MLQVNFPKRCCSPRRIPRHLGSPEAPSSLLGCHPVQRLWRRSSARGAHDELRVSYLGPLSLLLLSSQNHWPTPGNMQFTDNTSSRIHFSRAYLSNWTFRWSRESNYYGQHFGIISHSVRREQRRTSSLLQPRSRGKELGLSTSSSLRKIWQVPREDEEDKGNLRNKK